MKKLNVLLAVVLVVMAGCIIVPLDHRGYYEHPYYHYHGYSDGYWDGHSYHHY